MHNITSILLSLAATSILPAAEVPDLTSVRQYLKPSVTDGTVAGGSVLIIHKGKVIYGSVFGYFDRKTKKPFKFDSPVIVDSISKPVLRK
jgi:CubicO group peptidase (beta-lactamase class C family)